MSEYPEIVQETKVLETSEYHGRQIVVQEVHQTREAFTRAPYTSRNGNLITPYPEAAIDRRWIEVRVNGRTYHGWNKFDGIVADAIQILTKKAKKHVDDILFDESIKVEVHRALGTGVKTSEELVANGYVEYTGRDVKDGAIVYVHGTGYWRSGVITKRSRKNVNVSYTTPSSNGRIFHKSVEKVWVRPEQINY